jgi:microcystin-dependent protein
MRYYSSITPEFTLTAELTETGDTLNVDTADNVPPVPFTLVLNPDTVKEEIVTVLDINGLQFTISRAEEGTDPAKVHLEGDTARHMITARDLQESQDHIAATESVHGISDTAYLVYTNSSQTLTNKQFTSPKINENVPVTATSSELNILDGALVSTTEINYLSGATSNIQSQFDSLDIFPVGSIMMYGGTTPPTGWLLCNGQSTTGYTELAGIVGANVPDLCGRAPIGYGQGSGLTNRGTIGAKVGAETHALTQSEMPRHNHSLDPAAIWGAQNTSGSGGYGVTAQPQSNAGISYTGGSGTAQAPSDGVAHNNMQPSTVVNFIIKH